MNEKVKKHKTGVKNPLQAAENFQWNYEFAIVLKPETLNDFFKIHPELLPTLSPKKITKIIQEGLKLTNTAWRTLFPKKSELFYHNKDHAIITGVTALELFLGAVACHQLYNLSDLEKILHTLYIAALLHEIDDWWNLPTLHQQKGYSQRFESVKKLIKQYLEKNRISSVDFNRILILDNFNKPPQESIFEAQKFPPQKGFLKTNTSSSLIDNLPSRIQYLVWEIFSNCLNAADFLQVINSTHMTQVKIDIDGKIYTKRYGPVVLALECQRLRPKALANLGWTNSQGEIDWKKITTTQEFLKFAKKRIIPAVPYLETFSPWLAKKIKKRLSLSTHHDNIKK